MANVKRISLWFGVFYVAIGVLGFVPGITMASDHPGHGLLLGIFAVNAIHNVVHLVAGAVLVAASMAAPGTARALLWLLTAIFAVLVPASLVAPIVEGVAINLPDTLLHLASAILTGWLALNAGREGAPARSPLAA